MSLRRAVRALPIAALALTHPALVRADAVPIDIVVRGSNRLSLDGVLGDWRRFTDLTAVDEAAQIVSGRDRWQGPDDASFGFALARDNDTLYLAAEVHDDEIVRSRAHGPHDDALVLSLGAPAGATRTVGYDIVIYPGEPGSYRGAVRFRGAHSGEITTAQVVEAPLRTGSGFSIEVAIPFRAIPEVLAGINSARARLAYQDADNHSHPNVDTVLATGPGDGQHVAQLPPIVGSNANGTSDLIGDFARSHSLDLSNALLDRSANFAGDAALERVVVFPGYIVAAGPGIAGGARYAFLQFPLANRDDLIDTDMRDVTGDGRQDVLLKLRVHGPNALTREVLYIYGAPNSADQLSQLFAIEFARSQGNNRVTNRLNIIRGSTIRVAVDEVTGFTASNFPRAAENGVATVLTPWGENRVVNYHWSDTNQRFDIENAEPNATSTAGGNDTTPQNSAPMAVAPTADAVMDAFRRQNGVPESARPSFSIVANFAGDATPESLQIFGRHLVVTGSHFMNGRSFYTVELPVNADDDVLGLSAGDVTDDGRAEALVRVRRASDSQVRGQHLQVVREYLLVYSIDDAHRGRVFAAETARTVAGDAIHNVVRPPPNGRNGSLTIDAGAASGGWNAQSYPFHDLPMQGFAPILLPWEGPHRVVYHWDGTGLVSQDAAAAR